MGWFLIPNDRKSGLKPDAGETTGGETKKETTKTASGTSRGGTTLAEKPDGTIDLRARLRDGSFTPDNDGRLASEKLASDLRNGYMTGDELINGVLKYNENEAKKDKATQDPIFMVGLLDKALAPLVHLSTDQMARAEGFVFITDGEGAKEAKEDKRFVTMEYDYGDKTVAYVFVFSSDGKLTEKQKKVMKELGKWAQDKKQELKIFGGDKIKADKSQPKETSKGIPIKVKWITRIKKPIAKELPDARIEEQDKTKGETEKQRQEEEEKAKEEVERQRKEEEERRREEEDLKRLKEENERNLKGSEFSGEELQKVREGIKRTKEAILRLVRQAKSEYTVKKYALYLCSVEEIIKVADENKNLMKLTLPWQKCQGLYPLEGNLTAALGAIANTKSEHEWTIVLDGIADAKRDWGFAGIAEKYFSSNRLGSNAALLL